MKIDRLNGQPLPVNIKKAGHGSQKSAEVPLPEDKVNVSGKKEPEMLNLKKASQALLAKAGEVFGISWRFKAEDDFSAPPALNSTNNTLIACDTHNLYSLNCGSGSKNWKIPLDSVTYAIPACGKDGSAYIWDKNKVLKSIKPDGISKWNREFGEIQSSPSVGEDGTIYICTKDRKLHAINPETGKDNWESKLDMFASARPVPGKDGSVVLVDDDFEGNTIYQFDKKGELEWKKKMDSSQKINGRLSTGSDGTVYAPCEDGNLYAFESDGTPKEAIYEGRNPLRHPPTEGKDGTLYLSTFTGKSVVALEPDGTKNWEVKLGGYCQFEPVLGHDGTIYVCGSDKCFYAISPDGKQIWKKQFKEALDEPPVVGADGTVYINTIGKEIYAISTPERVRNKMMSEKPAEGEDKDNIIIKENSVTIGGITLPRKNADSPGA